MFEPLLLNAVRREGFLYRGLAQRASKQAMTPATFFVKNGIGGLAITAAAIVAFTSLAPASDVSVMASLNDKVRHVIAYTVLGALFAEAFRARSWVVIALAVAAYGGAIELLQAIMPVGREASWLDQLANTTGAFAGVLALRFARR